MYGTCARGVHGAMERSREGANPDEQEGAADPHRSLSSHTPAPAPQPLSPLSLKLSSLREAEAMVAEEDAATADATPAAACVGAADDGGGLSARQPTDSAREEIERQVTAILEEVIGAYDAEAMGKSSARQPTDSAREEIARQVAAIYTEAMAMSSLGSSQVSSAQSSARGQERRSRPGSATVRPVSAKSRHGSAVARRSPRAAAAAGAPREVAGDDSAETTPGDALGVSMRTDCITGALPEVHARQRGKGTKQRRNTSPTGANPSGCGSISARRPWR